MAGFKLMQLNGCIRSKFIISQPYMLSSMATYIIEDETEVTKIEIALTSPRNECLRNLVLSLQSEQNNLKGFQFHRELLDISKLV